MLFHPRKRIAGLTLGLVAVMVACAPGAYPVDFFDEMHYQVSQRRQEPQRLAPPADAVPVSGARVPTTFADAASLQNPVERSAQNLDRGHTLYAVNCAACHGSNGDGRGFVANYFRSAGFVPPVAFNSDRVRHRSDGQLYWLISYGIGNMPGFGDLLAELDVWTVVVAIREFEGR
jgi:mono/diheme cytochrome c family protein